MNDFITIKTFTYPHEAEIVAGLLESEGIEVRILDANTASIHPLYSNAIGGVKLQVKEIDVEAALGAMAEESHGRREPLASQMIRGLDKATFIVPFFNRIPFVFRFLSLVGIISFLGLAAVYFLSKPSFEERLMSQRWCVQDVFFEGKKYTPHTVETRLGFLDHCNEVIVFDKGGRLTLPGFESSSINGAWKRSGDKMSLLVDTFQFVFNGDYVLEIKANRLVLRSSKTDIFCVAD